jgi:ABC-type multidrug transport system fused ATPase/permease subunit
MDSSLLNVALEVIDWAAYRQKKGALKLHMLLDGHDLRQFSPEILREKIGIVLQDVLIEPDTVFQHLSVNYLRNGN